MNVCAKSKAISQAKQSHTHSVEHVLTPTRFPGEHVVGTLVKRGDLEGALHLFRKLPERSVFSWTTMIFGYAMCGLGWEALRMFHWMQQERVQPNSYTFVSLLKASGKIANLEAGKRIHVEAIRYGCESNLFVANCLVYMYGKCGSIVDAQGVFDRLSHRDVVSWTAMLTACAEQGQPENALQFYRRMREEGFAPNNRTFASTLRACGMLADMEEGVLVDGQMIKVNALAMGKTLNAEAQVKGLDSDTVVGSILITLYEKCGSITDAWRVFDRMSNRDVVAWTGMLMAYAEQRQEVKALQLYQQMQEEGVSPNHRTLAGLVQACGMLSAKEGDTVLNGQCTKLNSLSVAKTLHAVACEKDFDSDPFVGGALISVYGKCGSLADAQLVFDRLSHRDVVVWTSILVGHVEHGKAGHAFKLYDQMLENGVSPDARSCVTMLQASCMLAEKEEAVVMDTQSVKPESLGNGKEMHSYIHMKGFDSHVFVGSTLVTMYGKSGSIVEAWDVFARLSQQDVVAWTAILTAYVDHNQAEKALQLYRQMQQVGEIPDEVTLASILQACGKIGNLSNLKQVHQSLVSTGEDLSPLLTNTLIHAYGRCASMADAQAIFDALPQPGVVSWTALIAGYSRQGDCGTSLRLYEKMQLVGVNPNKITFLAILSACSRTGEVQKGIEFFESMTRIHNLNPDIEHYVTMVDLLGRAGCFTRVQDLLTTMPMQPALSLWLCLLGACQKYGKVVLGEMAFHCAVHLQPKHAAAYILMANIYKDVGLVNLEKEIHDLRQKVGAWKIAGQSWIGHEQETHKFVVADKEHLQQGELYKLLSKLRTLITQRCEEMARMLVVLP